MGHEYWKVAHGDGAHTGVGELVAMRRGPMLITFGTGAARRQLVDSPATSTHACILSASAVHVSPSRESHLIAATGDLLYLRYST